MIFSNLPELEKLPETFINYIITEEEDQKNKLIDFLTFFDEVEGKGHDYFAFYKHRNFIENDMFEDDEDRKEYIRDNLLPFLEKIIPEDTELITELDENTNLPTVGIWKL